MNTAGYVPNDVLMEIFPRLPTRSLVRFSCVSKSWNSLVFSHELSKKHLQYSNKFRYRIMLLSYGGLTLEHFSLHSALNKLNVPVFDTNHVDKFSITTRMHSLSPHESYPYSALIGSCNGLICIVVGTDPNPCVSASHTIYLWNPSIQKSRKIPSFGEELGYKHVRAYGFGFDESRDDYKVVGFYFSTTNYNDLLVKIYSLKTGEVKKIKNHTGRWLASYYNHTTFANGKIHWFAKRMQTEHYWNQDDCCIAYLDLATEEYGEIQKPYFIKFCIDGLDTMTALPGGSLYVYCHSSRVNSADGNIIAWLVKPTYGLGKVTWAQAIIISIPVYSPLTFGHGNPLFILDNGVTVWLCGGNVITFNPNDLSVRPSQLNSHHGPCAGISYIESLVSPMTWDDLVD